ncbi:MAG TPA: hypothetical protein VGI77_03905 [Gaiellaceae bacterium]|jgi:hypothetical protein
MEQTETLDRLGDALEAATQRNLATHKGPRRGVIAAAVAAVVLVPAAAVAGAKLISNDDVAKSLPAGTLSLAGTDPTCTTVKDGVEYHCSLATAPAPEVSDWKGTVEPTVDKTKHVNGGCRSLNSAGTAWECYLGRAAVDQQIIGAGFLGEFSPSPGQG